MLLGELGEVAEPLVLPVVLPLELWSFKHFSFSAPIRLSQRLLPAVVDEAPVVPAPMLVPLEVVPAAELPVPAVPPVSPLVALGLVVVVAEPLTPVLLEAPVAVAPVLPVPLEVPAAGVVLLEVLVLDLLVAPEPLSDAQPAPKATSAAAVAAASSFSFIASLLSRFNAQAAHPR